MDKVLDSVDRCISDDMDARLNKPFSNEDVLIALKSMSSLKASGEEGLRVVFY